MPCDFLTFNLNLYLEKSISICHRTLKGW